MKTYHANPSDPDSVAKALLSQYRDQHTNLIDGCTVELEDNGQDFLEFDIEGRRITASRPFQDFVWVGRNILNETLAPGDYISLKPGRRINHRVVNVMPLRGDM